MDIPRLYKVSALPTSPTPADDGVYFVRPNPSVGYVCYIITNGVAVQQDAVTTAALTTLLGDFVKKDGTVPMTGNLDIKGTVYSENAVFSTSDYSIRSIYGSGLWRLKTKELMASDDDSDVSKIPANGIYSKGTISTGSHGTSADWYNAFLATQNLGNYVSKLAVNEDIDGMKNFSGTYTTWYSLNNPNNGRGFAQSNHQGFLTGTLNDFDYILYRNAVQKVFVRNNSVEFIDNIITPNATASNHAVAFGQLANYALLSQVYTQAQALALFVGLNGVQTIYDTKTFDSSPIVPNGTLAGHTVNLGQMENYVTTQVATQVTNQITNLGFAPKAHDYREITTNNTTVNVKQFRRVVVVLTDPSVVTVELSKDAFPGTVVTIQNTSVPVDVKMGHIKAGAADSTYSLDAHRSLQVSFSEDLDAWIVEQDNSLS